MTSASPIVLPKHSNHHSHHQGHAGGGGSHHLEQSRLVSRIDLEAAGQVSQLENSNLKSFHTSDWETYNLAEDTKHLLIEYWVVAVTANSTRPWCYPTIPPARALDY